MTDYTLYLGDCLDVMATMSDASIDLTVTSPPYDNLRTYGKDFDADAFDWHSIIAELYRLTKPGGVVVWVVADATIKGSETGTSFRQALWAMECGFNLHDTMIYETNKPPLSHNRYENRWEYMFVFSVGSPSTFFPMLDECEYWGQKRTSTMRQDSDHLSNRSAKGKVKKQKIRGNIWYLPRGGRGGCISVHHPASFPEALARDHILSWSNPGDVVLDPMMGSGTTGKMAVQTDRKFIGIELDAGYLEIAKQRIEAATMQPALLREAAD